ncbi:MAG: hypothetical protein ABR613_00415 [Actinomycetota bacterium]
MTKKNRKVRRLSALYPDVKCKILYQRDYLNLLVKYGLEEPSQGALLAGGEAEGAASTPEDPPSLFGPALAG